MIGKPIDFFAKIPANSGLHFLPIPFSKTFADYYGLGELTHKEYPNLVPEGRAVDAIVVPAVLAVFNWPKGHDRYRRVERFTENLFAKWDKFREPPRHPNGATSISPPPSPAGPAGASRKRCCVACDQRRLRTSRWRRASFRPSSGAGVPEHWISHETSVRRCSANFCNGRNSGAARGADFSLFGDAARKAAAMVGLRGRCDRASEQPDEPSDRTGATSSRVMSLGSVVQ